jgi:hypothetical protein
LGNLSTPINGQKLQKALHAKAKAEAEYCFYALYDKISREDINRAFWGLQRALQLNLMTVMAAPLHYLGWK